MWSYILGDPGPGLSGIDSYMTRVTPTIIADYSVPSWFMGVDAIEATNVTVDQIEQLPSLLQTAATADNLSFTLEDTESPVTLTVNQATMLDVHYVVGIEPPSFNIADTATKVLALAPDSALFDQAGTVSVISTDNLGQLVQLANLQSQGIVNTYVVPTSLPSVISAVQADAIDKAVNGSSTLNTLNVQDSASSFEAQSRCRHGCSKCDGDWCHS